MSTFLPRTTALVLGPCITTSPSAKQKQALNLSCFSQPTGVFMGLLENRSLRDTSIFSLPPLCGEVCWTVSRCSGNVCCTKLNEGSIKVFSNNNFYSCSLHCPICSWCNVSLCSNLIKFARVSVSEWAECLCSPQFVCLSPNPPCDGIWR